MPPHSYNTFKCTILRNRDTVDVSMIPREVSVIEDYCERGTKRDHA